MPNSFKRGKRPATKSRKDFNLDRVVDVAATLPKAPRQFGHEKGFPLSMLGNGPDPTVAPGFQGAGDCVFAGAVHETRLVEHASGRAIAPITGKEAIAAYSAVTGYRIGNDATDQGTDVRQALTWRRKTGIADANGKRHKIGAFLSLEPGNVDHLVIAMYLFGAVGIGIQFPDSAMTQFDRGQPWSVVAGSRIDGGHYIPLVARRSATQLQCITWGRIQKMTNTFYEAMCDEAWAIVPTEYLKPNGKTPEGFDQKTLNAMLAKL